MERIDDRNRRWWILAAMGGVLALIVLDATVVGVALPTVRRDLGMSEVASHWVVNIYLLVFTVSAAAAGKLGDHFGHRGFFVAGVALFGLASALCGLAQGGTMLLGARALQGIGAAVIFPASVAMIAAVFRPEERGLAFGIQTTTGGTFMTLGPFVGGLLTDLLSWRWIFWVNLPIVAAIAVIVLAAWVEPESKERPPPVDLVGLVALVAGLGIFVFAVMEAPERDWSFGVTGLMAAGGAAILAVFVVHELRTSTPLIELGLFRGGTFTTSNLIVFTGQFSQIAIVVICALYLQYVLRMSPLGAGTALLVAVAPTLLTSIAAGRLADRLGARRPGLTGLALHTAALLWIGLVVDAESYDLLVPGLVVWGATLPFLMVPPRRAIMATVPQAKQGQASGVNLTSQLLGGTVGVTVCGTILATTGDFRMVYLATAALALIVLAIAWRAFERRGAAALHLEEPRP